MKPIASVSSTEEADQDRARPTGEQVVIYALWPAAIFAGVGTVIAFAIDLHLPGHGRFPGPLSSTIALLPGAVVVAVLMLAIRRTLARRFWPACRIAGGAMLLAIVFGALYVAGLGGACGQLSDCRHAGAVVDLVAASQFLFVLAAASAIVAAITSFGVALARSRSLY